MPLFKFGSTPAAGPAPDNAVEFADLTKIYRGQRGRPPRTAVDHVSLAIPRGSFFGLLGPNGAGKSTMINILAGLVTKTSGSAMVWGFDIDRNERQARCAIGVVPQELNLDPFFTPREVLDVQAGMYGVPSAERRTDAILEAVGLSAQADAYARSLSGGMRRRLLVAKAMVHEPPILVLDEPTAGVDIQLRQQLWSYVRGLNRRGTTVLLTTHYLEEAQELCDRVAIIDQGRVIACDSTDALLRRIDGKSLTITVREAIAGVPDELLPFAPEPVYPNRLRFHYRPSNTHIDAMLAAVQAAGLTIVDLSTEETDLEDIFLQLTQRSMEAR